MKLELFCSLLLSLAVVLNGRPCNDGCGNDIEWTQSVKEAENSVHGPDSYICHTCVNTCIQQKMMDKFGADFDMAEADCDQKNEYYVWHFGTGMVECMEEAGKGKCMEQMKFSCGYDYKNMMKIAGDGCKWTEQCKKWGYDNEKFTAEDPDWEPYSKKK